jgi:hypothetical protein
MEQTRNPDASNMALGWVAFHKEQRNPGCGGSLMKPIPIESPIGSDRLSTWNEVLCAMSSSSQGTIEITAHHDDSSEMKSELSGHTGNLPEDDMWLAIVSEMPDSKCN